MPLSFDTAHRLAMADIKATMAREGRTVMTGADLAELNRLIGCCYTDNRPARRGAEDDIRYSETGWNGSRTMLTDEGCR